MKLERLDSPSILDRAWPLQQPKVEGCLWQNAWFCLEEGSRCSRPPMGPAGRAKRLKYYKGEGRSSDPACSGMNTARTTATSRPWPSSRMSTPRRYPMNSNVWRLALMGNALALNPVNTISGMMNEGFPRTSCCATGVRDEGGLDSVRRIAAVRFAAMRALDLGVSDICSDADSSYIEMQASSASSTKMATGTRRSLIEPSETSHRPTPQTTDGPLANGSRCFPSPMKVVPPSAYKTRF